MRVLAVARCSSSLSAVLRTECGLGLVLLDGLLHALRELAQRGDRHAGLVPLGVHDRVSAAQDVGRVLGGVGPTAAPAEGNALGDRGEGDGPSDRVVDLAAQQLRPERALHTAGEAGMSPLAPR